MLDQKKKVIGMMFREGQVEYFGKKGMSLLGSMEVRQKESSDGSQSQGFHYYFVEYVTKWYSG